MARFDKYFFLGPPEVVNPLLPTNLLLRLFNKDVMYLKLDKKIKSDLIFFNAESFLKDVVGYFSAQRKSHYFGKLLNFNLANPREVYAVEDCQSILENFLRDYE